MTDAAPISSNAHDIKKEYRLLIAIFTCPKNIDRANAVRDTWLNFELPPDVLAFFVMGRPGEPPGFETDVLYLDCPEAYEKLPLKTWKLLEYCLATFKFEHLLKCDDDSYIFMPRTLAIPLQEQDYAGRFYGHFDPKWHLGKCDDPALDVPYRREIPKHKWAEGAGYFLSSKAAALVLDTVSIVDAGQELYEDVMVGVALRPRSWRKRDSLINVKQLRFRFKRYLLHPVTPYQMRRIHLKRPLSRVLLGLFYTLRKR